MPRSLLLGLIFLSFYATLGYYPLFNLDEGAFSEATREMLLSGDYITTYLNGALRFDKPILIYWLQALSAWVLGLNEFAMRLPSALAATLWAYLIYRFTKRWIGEKEAFWATFFMVGSLQISIIAKAAIADALLNLFITASMFCYFTYYKTKRRSYLYATFAAIGLGTLTKGPVAIMIPLVVTFLFLLKDLRFWLQSILNPIGIAIFLAIAAPWYIAEYLDQGEKFIQGFFLKHNISRFKGAMEGHRGSIFYYIPVLLVGLLPFTSIFLKALIFIKEWFKEELRRYLALWFLFVFIFFSLSGTKLPHYVIYGYTPLFILMALYFDKVRNTFLLLLPYLLFCAIFLALPFVKELILSSMKPGRYDTYIVEGLEFDTSYILFFTFALIAGIYAAMRLSKEKAIILAAFFTIIGLNFFIAKTYANAAEEPIKEAALYAKQKGLKVVMEGINTPSFAFYYEAITPRRSPKKGEALFTKRSNLKNYPNFDILFQKNGVALIKEKE
ncbi:MAG: phospholipid carrier-dependent glycosyltransferase [Epsilonproteobacteria bacterium]|nr:phospholipid carrier-dependent glycosyltransferase [Campylobacterota bacterium]NPA64700.1 glycosyltransferase family 39 protein [Campylobacterota bacterium]